MMDEAQVHQIIEANNGVLLNPLRPKSANSHSFLVALKSEECTSALFYLPSISQSKTLLLSFNGYQALSANQMKR